MIGSCNLNRWARKPSLRTRLLSQRERVRERTLGYLEAVAEGPASGKNENGTETEVEVRGKISFSQRVTKGGPETDPNFPEEGERQECWVTLKHSIPRLNAFFIPKALTPEKACPSVFLLQHTENNINLAASSRNSTQGS